VNKEVVLTAVFTDNGPATGTELVSNGDFSGGDKGWAFGAWAGAKGTSAIENGEYVISMTTAGTEGWNAQLNTTGLDISKGKLYEVSFKARADKPYKLSIAVGMTEDPWSPYSGSNAFALTPEMKSYSFKFAMDSSTDRNARVAFDMGTYAGKLYIDDVSVKPIEGTGINEPPDMKPGQSKHFFQHLGGGVFSFTTAVSVHGTFELFSVDGVRLARMPRSDYAPGTYSLYFRDENISPGVYQIRLVNGNTVYSSQSFNILR
jgi:hypothetical protein